MGRLWLDQFYECWNLPLSGQSRGLGECTYCSCNWFWPDVLLIVTLCRFCLAGLPVGYQFRNITNADVNNLLLEDLIIWTNYEIEVAAYNSAGLGVYSSKVTEWTLQGGKLLPLGHGKWSGKEICSSFLD